MAISGTVQKTETVPIDSSSDVVLVRQRVRIWTTEMKFSLVEQTKIVTAASELGRNTLEHGGGGSLELALVANGTRQGLRLAIFRHGTRNRRHRSGVERRLHHGIGAGAWVRRQQAADE